MPWPATTHAISPDFAARLYERGNVTISSVPTALLAGAGAPVFAADRLKQIGREKSAREAGSVSAVTSRIWSQAKPKGLAHTAMSAGATQFAAIMLAGCTTSPAQNILGSFFPAWMLCAAAGIVIAVLSRLVLGALGVSQYLIAPPLTHLSVAMAGTLLVWLLWFGH